MVSLNIWSVLALIFMFASIAKGEEEIVAIECPLPDNPEVVTQDDCSLYTACLWSEESQVCHMQDNEVAGYSYAEQPIITDYGFVVNIEKNYDNVTMFGGDINNLQLSVNYFEDYHVQIKIYDLDKIRYEVPLPLNIPAETSPNPLADVTVGQEGDSVILNVTRRSNGAELFRTVGPITFEDQFIQFTVRLSSQYLYGFGENIHSNLKHSFYSRTTYPIFARDEHVARGEANHYGVFPYYVNIEDDEGNTHSVLFYNSNAMEYSLFELPDGAPAVTFRCIGGIIDIHIFAGPTPEDVSQQYATMVGTPVFPPYWALGFHLSRWGYGSTEGVREVRNRTREAGIPQDVQTLDIDYMDERRDFTFDPVNFADLPELVEEFHNENIRTVLILDPAIAMKSDYETYTNGRNVGAYVRWISPDLVPDGQPEEAEDFIIGKVWPPESTVFPDFFNQKTKEWWINEIITFRKKVNFDGLWIDMNEPANFDTNLYEESLQCPGNELDSPPYSTKATTQEQNLSQRLSDKTICMSSLHTDGTKTYRHYDVHSLYGYSETVATYEALETLDPGVRPFLLSRSTFPGSGRYAIHWLGDNSATWDDLRDSIIGMIEFNLFGIPMVGADVCGFSGEPSKELCARWMQLGAFYPFDRNHNHEDSPDQDPAVWPEVAEISREVLLLRYKYLPYLYSLFHNAHMKGSSVIRPLFNVFPDDIIVRDSSDEFFWGDAIMVAPVLYEGAVTRDVYFPEGVWYDLVSGEQVSPGHESVTVDAPLEKIPVYIRGGKIVPFQEPAVTTVQSRLNDFGLLVALDDTQFASGEVFWDDGELEHVMSETYLSDVVFYQGELVMVQKFNAEAAEGVNLGTIRILGLPSNPDIISVNGIDFTNYDYDSTNQILDMTVNLPLKYDFEILIHY